MKKHLPFIVLLFLLFGFGVQQGYPEPPATPHRLFYIQHSNNHNTFVYDVNFANPKKIDETDPIKVYRITYTNGGIKEELTTMQRKLAYGIDCKKTGTNIFECTLAAYPTKKLLLKLHPDGKPYVTVATNGKNIILKKLFLLVNKTGTNVIHIDFYGKDATTGKELKERFVVPKK